MSLTPPRLRRGSVPATASPTAGMGGARPLPPNPPTRTSVAISRVSLVSLHRLIQHATRETLVPAGGCGGGGGGSGAPPMPFGVGGPNNKPGGTEFRGRNRAGASLHHRGTPPRRGTPRRG